LRSVATLDSLYNATMEVLVADGYEALTIIGVADRAGLTAAAIDKFFPNKQALVCALIERHLEAIVERLETVCRDHHGSSLAQMVECVVHSYWLAEFKHWDLTRALYRVMGLLDTAPMIGHFSRRVEFATATMLATAPGCEFTNVSLVALTIHEAIFGALKSVFQRDLPPSLNDDIRGEVMKMVLSYLNAVATPVLTPL
jgi:AcrR family transcriptional regulator